MSWETFANLLRKQKTIINIAESQYSIKLQFSKAQQKHGEEATHTTHDNVKFHEHVNGWTRKRHWTSKCFETFYLLFGNFSEALTLNRRRSEGGWVDRLRSN
jgi:hypothetical protein